MGLPVGLHQELTNWFRALVLPILHSTNAFRLATVVVDALFEAKVGSACVSMEVVL